MNGQTETVGVTKEAPVWVVKDDSTERTSRSIWLHNEWDLGLDYKSPEVAWPKIQSQSFPSPIYRIKSAASGIGEPMVSTALLVPLPELEATIRRLFVAAREEAFEDGMVSDFSNALTGLIEKHGQSALEILSRLIRNNKPNSEVVAEALRWLGYMSHEATHNARRRILEESLNSPSARVRDGALLGLAGLDDPLAIPLVEQAIAREPIPELREDLQQVLSQLENTRKCLSS